MKKYDVTFTATYEKKAILYANSQDEAREILQTFVSETDIAKFMADDFLHGNVLIHEEDELEKGELGERERKENGRKEYEQESYDDEQECNLCSECEYMCPLCQMCMYESEE